MKVSLGVRVDYSPGSFMGKTVPNQSANIPAESISVVYKYDPQGLRREIEIYFMDEEQKVGRITLSPFEFRKIMHEGNRILVDNKVPG